MWLLTLQWELLCRIYMYHITALYTLNFHNVICQLYLSRAAGAGGRGTSLLTDIQHTATASHLCAFSDPPLWIPCHPRPSPSQEGSPWIITCSPQVFKFPLKSFCETFPLSILFGKARRTVSLYLH